jgi:hypothetical protein
MKDWAIIRERFLLDGVPIRLGSLAANLHRIKSFTAHTANRDVVESLIDESKFLIEWTAREAEIGTAAQLAELQIQLAVWHHDWPVIWADSTQRNQVSELAGVWSDRVLALSGLLKS